MGSCLVKFLKKSRHSESKLDFASMSDDYDDETFEPMLRNDSDELFQKATPTAYSTSGLNSYHNDTGCSKSPIFEMQDRGDGLFRKPCCNCACDMHKKCENSVESTPERNWNVSTTELLIQVERESTSMAGENSAWETENSENTVCTAENQNDLFGLFTENITPVPVDQSTF